MMVKSNLGQIKIIASIVFVCFFGACAAGNNIKISEIVLKSFKNKIEQNKLLKIQDNGSVRLKLKVILYGFSRAGEQTVMIAK